MHAMLCTNMASVLGDELNEKYLGICLTIACMYVQWNLEMWTSLSEYNLYNQDTCILVPPSQSTTSIIRAQTGGPKLVRISRFQCT